MSGIAICKRTNLHKLVHSQFGWIILLLLSLEGGCLSTSSSKQSVPQYKNGKGPNMMDMNSNFDFDFDWDGEPPEFISQLDLEVKWDDDDMGKSKSSKVSIQNVSMNGDYDITGPMTKLITTVANNSFHENHVNNMIKENGNGTMETTGPLSKLASCSCEEIHSLIKDLQFHPPTTPKPSAPVKGDSGDESHRKKRGCKRCKGEKGDPGLSIVGPKGEPGHPGMLPYHLLHPENLKGERGTQGPRGPPGHCPMSCSPQSPPPALIQRPPIPGTSTVRPTAPLPLTKPNYRIVPGALVFKTFPSMNQMSTYVMLGSVAFVEESEEFYGKMKTGWRKFQMGPLIS